MALQYQIQSLSSKQNKVVEILTEMGYAPLIAHSIALRNSIDLSKDSFFWESIEQPYSELKHNLLNNKQPVCFILPQQNDAAMMLCAMFMLAEQDNLPLDLIWFYTMTGDYLSPKDIKCIKENWCEVKNIVFTSHVLQNRDSKDKLLSFLNKYGFEGIFVEHKMLSPYRLTDMDKAIDFIFEALLSKKNICVVADYDADGATSCSIMIKGLLGLGQSKNNIKYFLPDRIIHGYGLQPSVVDDMLSHYPNTEVIITVDNGISAVTGVDYAVQKGIQVVVTDHHAEGDVRPHNAVAIVNPNRKDCTFPSKAIAGCGVSYYTILCLSEKFKAIENINSYSPEQQDIIQMAKNFDTDDLLDYLAIGTIADVVKLDFNNRFFVFNGLRKMRQNKGNVGVNALLSIKGIEEHNIHNLVTENISFGIGPIINAVGRLDDMTYGVQMLLADKYTDSLRLANMADQFNQDRKLIESDMVYQANEIIEKLTINNNDYKYSCALLLDEGHEGVVGIVASRVKERLYKPTIIFVEIHDTHDGYELIKGSGRSIEGLHIRDALEYVSKKAPDCIIKFGGHAMAAGLTIRKDKLSELQKYFDEYCEQIFQGIEPSQTYLVDQCLELSKVNINDVKVLNAQTWGQGYLKPIYFGQFVITGQRILNNKATGQPAHLKLNLQQNGFDVDAIWFGQKEAFLNEKLDLIYQLSINEWMGVENLQLMVIAGQGVD